MHPRKPRNLREGLLSLPNDVLSLIDGMLDTKTSHLFSQTCFLLFHIAHSKSGLQYVAKGPQIKAVIFNFKSAWYLELSQVTDWSRRTFKAISAFQYAYWAKDILMLKHFYRDLQCGDQQTQLTNVQVMLKQIQTLEENSLEHGASYSMQALINAYNAFITFYNTSGWRDNHAETFRELERKWSDVRRQQCLIPLHMLETVLSFDNKNIDENNKDFFALKVNDTVSKNNRAHTFYTSLHNEDSPFALIRGHRGTLSFHHTIHAACRPTMEATMGAKIDRVIFENLDKQRTQEREEFKTLLLTHQECLLNQNASPNLTP